jgi:hypothetical protein
MIYDREDARFLILKLLYKKQSFTTNQEIILKELREHGHALNRDQLHVELAWLDKIADALVDQVSGGVHIATLTADGLEAVDGSREIPGIRRPRPGEVG